MWYTKGKEREQIIKQLAKASDKALDEAYDYGIGKPGTFDYDCKISGAKEVLSLLENGETDIEVLSDASHEGWAKSARVYDDPIYKTRPEKRKKRLELAATAYKDLTETEQEIDRVAAKALLAEYEDICNKHKDSP